MIYSYRLTNGTLLTPINEFQINRTSNYDEKFEVEGIVVLNASKYIVCNCESNKGGDYNKDGLFKIKKK